ncbi:MAG: Site-specific tyrosine recombinase XerD [uncultured Rubrobacteraceae bacterium]|uniref:Site-specific tyrosine recombinase XerD n=1 Tax=uncultured Rubrobacteraceae bacterium TaxID=349277 RepID=A0A6J4S9K5_9ACTN|nr:MAG: Site-specific tyrosine recombinase XerD [uncultured Rubrobacteraceae bacterium]
MNTGNTAEDHSNLPAITEASAVPAPQSPTPSLDRLLDAYLRTLSSPATIRTYNTEIRMFAGFLTRNLGGRPMEEVSAEDLGLYREHLMLTYAPATAAKKLAALRRFLTFTYMVGATRVSPEALRFFAKSPRVAQDPSYNVLTEDELSRMLSAARTSNWRDYALLAVLAGAGLREAEVVGLKIGDFQEVGDGQVLVRVEGKGRKIRAVPVSPELWSLVQRHVSLSGRSLVSRTDARKPLFASREGRDKPLTTRAIRYIVKKYARAARITKAISPHSIRHTVGTNMAVNEAPLLVIQQFLGHSDPKTTLRYIRRAEDLANRAYTYNTLPTN